MSDLNACGSSRLNAGLASTMNARTRERMLNYYRAEELAFGVGALDESDDPANLAYFGGITIIAGQIGSAFRFAGGAGGVENDFPPHVPDPPITIRFWFRAPNPIVDLGAGGGRIVENIGSSGYKFSVLSALGKIQLQVVSALGPFATIVSSISVNDQAWHRVVGSWDGTTVKLYIDDNAPDTAALSGRATFDGLSWHNEDPDNTYDGDELGLWGLYLWTDADLAYDWNGGAGRTWPEAANIG